MYVVQRPTALDIWEVQRLFQTNNFHLKHLPFGFMLGDQPAIAMHKSDSSKTSLRAAVLGPLVNKAGLGEVQQQSKVVLCLNVESHDWSDLQSIIGMLIKLQPYKTSKDNR